jgi:RNA polymerase sigma-70 factor, ECF subfamily
LFEKRVTDQNFIGLLKRKDEAALDYVVDTYGGLIKAVVHRHLSAFPDDCGECVNDILLTVWEHSEDFDPERSSFPAWLSAVSKYKAIDFKRRRARTLAETPLTGEEPSERGNPEETVLADEIDAEAQSLLEHLSEDDRKLFWGRYVDGQPAELLAKQRNIKVSALYNRLSRDRKKLKNLKEANL